jgi:hypothetical protein
MAGYKISELIEITQLQDDHLFVIADITEGKNKKFKFVNLNLGQIKIGNPPTGSYTGLFSWTSASVGATAFQDVNASLGSISSSLYSVSSSLLNVSQSLQTLSTGSHIQNTDIGTTSQTFLLHSGSTSVLLKESGSRFDIRNSDDTNFADIRAEYGTFNTLYSNNLIVSNSIIHHSGSTQFGDSPDDTHQFTGSLFISGNISTTSIVSQSIVYASTGGYLTGSSHLYYDGTDINVTSGGINAAYKSFKIPHPTKTGMSLVYGSLEGPEHSVYIRGRSTSLILNLPEYWTKLVDENSITVQISPIGHYQKIYVEKIENNSIYLKQSFSTKIFGNFTDGLDYFYTVFGERKDILKLKVEL